MRLRNKCHFFVIHRSMNAMGLVQSKGVMLTLHGTPSIHTLMNVRKMKFISYIYTLLLHRFVHYLWRFDVNLVKQVAKKSHKPACWLLRSTAVSMTWPQSNVTSPNQLFYLSLTSLTRNFAWTSVVHRCMNLVGPKEVHLRKLLARVNITVW